MTMLEEIFKDKPELLDEPAVKELVKFAHEQHKKALNVYKKYYDFHEKVIDTCCNTEVFIVNGSDCKSAIMSILDEIEKV